MQIGWSCRPQDIVFHLHPCVKHLPSRIPKKLSCCSRFWALAPCSANLCQDSAKTFLKKHFTGAKRYYRAFVRCGVWGSKPHPFVISDRRPRCLLIDRLDLLLDLLLDLDRKNTRFYAEIRLNRSP